MLMKYKLFFVNYKWNIKPVYVKQNNLTTVQQISNFEIFPNVQRPNYN